MRRLAVVMMHVFALPIGLLIALILGVLLPPLLPDRGVSIELHDTYFIVAHLHASIVLASSLLVVTFVAYAYHSLNWAVHTSWVAFILHLLAALVAWRVSVIPEARGSGTVSFIPPAYPGSAILYLGSAAAALVCTVIALLISLVRALQSPKVGRA
jgi:hypothetical protein